MKESCSRSNFFSRAVWLVGILLLQSIVGSAQDPSSDQAATNAAPSVMEGITTEIQWRPGLDASRFPLIQVYLSNNSDKAVEWGKVLLNEKEAGK